MPRALIAFVLGFAAFALVAGIGATALAVAADAGGWPPFRIRLGSLTLLAFERVGAGTATTYGPGIGVLAIVGGALNALGALVLGRRAR